MTIRPESDASNQSDIDTLIGLLLGMCEDEAEQIALLEQTIDELGVSPEALRQQQLLEQHRSSAGRLAAILRESGVQVAYLNEEAPEE